MGLWVVKEMEWTVQVDDQVGQGVVGCVCVWGWTMEVHLTVVVSQRFWGPMKGRWPPGQVCSE